MVVYFLLWWVATAMTCHFCASHEKGKWSGVGVETDTKKYKKVFPLFWRLIKYLYRSAWRWPIRPCKLDQSESLNSLKDRKTYFTSLNKSDQFPVLKKFLTAWRFRNSLKTIFVFVVRNANDWKEVIELLATRFFSIL